MEEQKKSREQVLEEQVEELRKENEQLKKDNERFEEWWRKADAKNMELAESVNLIYTSAKS